MRFNQQLSRVITLCVAASMLAACSGAHAGGLLPSGGTGPTSGTPNKSAATTFHAFIPSAPTSSSSNSRRPQYISNQGTSSLVVSVVPTDPAEAAQWSTLYGASGFTVCYNIFTNGAIASPLAAGVTVTAVAGGYDVNFPFPSPPGQDTFTISQYVGACSATNPYTAPTAAPSPVPTLSPAQLLISQSPPLVVNIVANAPAGNNFNVQLSACNTPPGAGPVNQPVPGYLRGAESSGNHDDYAGARSQRSIRLPGAIDAGFAHHLGRSGTTPDRRTDARTSRVHVGGSEQGRIPLTGRRPHR